MDKVNVFEKWAKEYKDSEIRGIGLTWPSETLVRLFKGDYIPDLKKDYRGKKVLDVGFGNGNNLFFLGTLGLELYGTEVHKDIVDLVSQKLKRFGHQTHLKIGTNRELPFNDNEFDFLVSWNVIHYEDSEDKMIEAIQEYRRVLKPCGRFFISTTGPEHKILEGSEIVSSHLYKIKREDDFRRGQIYFYFDTPDYIRFYFSRYFTNILIGRVHDFLMTETLDWFIVTGLKPNEV